VRWETERPIDVRLCHEYVYQKLLKLDSPSSSYSRKKFGVFLMPHSVLAPSVLSQVGAHTLIRVGTNLASFAAEVSGLYVLGGESHQIA